MDPKIWGPHFWFVLHFITFNYPDNPTTYDKQSHKVFFESVKDILPCEKCRRHYRNHIAQFPLEVALDNRIDLIKWLIQVHNIVNKSLNKPEYSLKDVLYIYSNLEPVSPFAKVNLTHLQVKKKVSNYGRIYVFIILAVCLAIYLFKYSKKYFYYR